MRVLVTTTGGAGHFGPLVPFVDALLAARDEVLIATRASMAEPNRAAIETLAPLPVRLLVTIGRDRDPAELGPLPANVHVERWVPQADVMPHAAAMVCHGGSGSVLAGLAAGVPMVVLPLFADQPYNAARVAELGAGVALEQGPAGIAGAPGAVRALLADPAYAERAAAVAADVRALPTIELAVEALRDVAAARR